LFERPELGERALLIHLKFKDPRLSADLREFKELAISAGAEVVDTVISKRDAPDPKFLIGLGKVEEIAALVKEHSINIVLFNHALSPTQERNLEKALACRVLDRTGLILDIFAQRAKTFEGKLQVELAQLEHLSTRLVRGWTHLERQKGGIGLRGPGETQLEEDRRNIKQKIQNIRKRLEKVHNQRRLNRQARDKAQISTVALVGYTNSGKSTLFKALTDDENVFIADQLFATLDLTLRTVPLAKIGKAIFVDTVGFVSDLPHELVDAFHATLEETIDADLLLHVIDCSDDIWREKKLQVEKVLHQIGAINVPMLEVYNKIDLVESMQPGFENDYQNIPVRVKISAARKIGLDFLKDAVSERLCDDLTRGQLTLPATLAKARFQLYEVGAIESEKVDETGNYVVEINLQKERWHKICATFPGLEKLLQTKCQEVLQSDVDN
jgi:GTP-binding protein HflX